MLGLLQEVIDAEAIAALQPPQNELMGYAALVALLTLPFVIAFAGMRRARSSKAEPAPAPAPAQPAPRASRAARARKAKKAKPSSRLRRA